MSASSYLPDVAGGMVTGGSFADDAAADAAIGLLRGTGVRPQDITVVARDPHRAARLAGDRAWFPGKGWDAGLGRIVRRLLGDRLPREVRARYGPEIDAGRIVVIAAADGQPADTLAALLAQAAGRSIEQWWQPPAKLFAPPELAGPF